MPLIFPTSTRPLVLRPTYSAMRRRGISGIATSGAENALHIVRHNSASRSFPHIVTQKSGSRSLLPSVAQKSGSTNSLTMRPFSECSAGPVLARHQDSNRAGKSPFKDGIRRAELRWRMAPEHIEGDGETIFRHACKLGLEGIVSKRKDSPYRSGRFPDWLKMKNPAAPAVKREAEEDWAR